MAALPLIAGCALSHKSAQACTTVDPSALPTGVFIGQELAQARGVLGKPLQEIYGDFSDAGGAIVTLHYRDFTIRVSSVTGDVVGQFEWTAPGTGPNRDIRVGEPLHGPIGHTMIFDGMYGRTGEIPTIPVCRAPHKPKTRVVYAIRDGKVDYVYLQTWKFPF